MQPFLILPRIVVNSDGTPFKVQGRVRPDEIADYYQGAYNGTVVVLRSGSSFLLDMDIENFDSLIAMYYASQGQKKPTQVHLIPPKSNTHGSN